MAAAIEVYNKPGFPYRTESFTILAINAWELLLKSKWLHLKRHNISSLYIYDSRQTLAGTKSKRQYVRRRSSGTPFTLGMTKIASNLLECKVLDQKAHINIIMMLEFRNSAAHFYNQSTTFNTRLHELGAACVRNFVQAVEDWFNRSVSELGVHLMPLTLLDAQPTRVFLLKPDEERFLGFLDSLSTSTSTSTTDPDHPYSIALQVNVTFTKSKLRDAVLVRKDKDPSAVPIALTEQDVRDKYPWDYAALTERCKRRYDDFKENKQYHQERKALLSDERFAYRRYLDPGNTRSSVKVFYNPNILQEFDKQYNKRVP